MKKLMSLAMVSLFVFGVAFEATAYVRVAERVVAWSTATKAQELVRALGLEAVPQAQMASKLQQLAASGSPLAQTYLKQEAIFKSLILVGAASQETIDKAFEQAFVRNGQLLSQNNVHAFAAESTQQTASIFSNAVNSQNAVQSKVGLCEATPANYLRGPTLAQFNKGLQTATSLTGINLVSGNSSCANWDAEMASGFAQLVIKADQIVDSGTRNYGEALLQAYSDLMNVPEQTSMKNLKTLIDDCSIMPKEMKSVIGI